jgi:hypothetical protein
MTNRQPTTDSRDQPVRPIKRRRSWPRFDLSVTQLVATALAAITATVVGSYLGVSGTVLGAAVASVVAAIGNAVYSHSLRSTRDRVREVVPVARFTGRPAVAPAGPPTGERPPVLPVSNPRRRERNPWRGIALGSISVFVAVLAVITGVEVVAGRPISDLVRGESGSGTSVFGDAPQTSGGGSTPSGTPTVTKTVTPSVIVTTPTATRTAPTVTKTVTPTATATPSTPATPSSPPTTPSSSSSPNTDPSGTASQVG